MGELQSALDALAGEDLDGMVASQFLDRTSMLVRARNRIDAELARTARRAELAQAPEHDGLKSMASWLRGHLRLSPAAANQIVRNGRALEQLPAVAAGCADGRVTAEQVSVIAPVTRPENVVAAAEQGVDLAAGDAALATVAGTRQYVDLGKVVHHYLSRLDPDGPEPDPTESRSLSLAKHADGSLTGRLELDAVGGEKLQAALESILQANRPAGDTRTRAQQLGDALVQLADNALAAGNLPFLRTVKPHVVVTIGVDDLADPSTGPGVATTGFGAIISAARAPLARLRRQHHPHRHRPRGPAAGRRALQAGVSPAHSPGRPDPRPALRLQRLPRPHPLVRRPPCPRMGARRRPDLRGERCTPLRAAPHEGPPRIPR